LATGALPDGAPPAAYGQIPGLPTAGTAGEAELPLGVERRGLIETAGVALDGRELFRIASPVVYNRAAPGDLTPVEVRAREIEAKLERLVSRGADPGAGPARPQSAGLDPETLRVQIETRNGQPVLVAADARGAAPEELLTVTDLDAQYHGLAAEELAQRWQEAMEGELPRALVQRRPEASMQRLVRLVTILLITLLGTALLAALTTALGKRREWLREQQKQAEQATVSRAEPSQDATAKAHASRQAAAPHAGTGEGEGGVPPAEAAEEEDRQERNLLSHVLGEQLTIERRLQINGFLRWLLSWAIIFLWVAALAASLYQFPQTRGIADRIVSTPVLILIGWFAAGLLNGFAGLLIDRMAKAWGPRGRHKEDPRRALRIPTVVAALKGLSAAILYTIAVIWVLESLRIVPVTAVALGAVAALALSFAAQSLVKDLVNGLLILAEDQYALGDDVIIGDVGGIVERLNLRSTQLRTMDGHLVTIPNHTITQVENKTRHWSRVDLHIAVSYGADVDQALAVVGQVAEEMARDPQWRLAILKACELLGVEEVTHTGIVIRILVKTLPFKQGSVARELRRRLKIAFDREGIQIGIPQQEITVGAAAGWSHANGLLPGSGSRDSRETEREENASAGSTGEK
jgi:small conductance mechanosensitive channel